MFDFDARSDAPHVFEVKQQVKLSHLSSRGVQLISMNKNVDFFLLQQ